jgi:hypothetical protein
MVNKRVESASRQAVGQRNYRRVRDRALVRLAQDYPIEYRNYYEEEKKRDELEGKKWDSLADSPVYGVDYEPPRRGSASSTEAGEGSEQGNDGAKA